MERQWDDQMQYLIAVSGRCFPIGGSIPISLTFMPWTKMKIFRLAVVIEGKSPMAHSVYIRNSASKIYIVVTT